ncbi:alpha/beta fold hydrolase [Amantichitinum ursilacus]|uniref:Arylesterase n=1 Tax=Amantichitinum ursilacus TaxID=857265 RepID=A0A0N0XKI0_9NEIS|nr:alpha/beta hydrolase [Amantichitinum ursilacus]KPC54181.1 Arylesterase [Amantichitinum ursilacus]
MKIHNQNVELNVIDTAVGDVALVFQHHWGGSAASWNTVIEQLRGQFRCVAIDARGAGDSSAPAIGYSTADHASDARAVIEALGLKRYLLVGHSMGGKAAQLLASQQPAGLEGVVLVASSPLSPMAIDEAQRQQMHGAYAFLGAVEFTLDNVLLGSTVAPPVRQQLRDDALRLSLPGKNGWLEVGSREDFSARAAQVNVPVTIIAGELDRVDPVEVITHKIAPLYPAAELHLLPGKGHLLPAEAPQDLANIIRKFATRAVPAQIA